jgi:signal transduction histidine kinase
VNDEKYLLAVFIAGTVLITVFAVVMTVFLVINKQRQNRAKLERQQLEFTYNSTLLKTKIEMQEQALEFVSQEIHDNVGQVLSFSCLQLSNIRSAITDPEAKASLTENLEIIRQAVKELRLLSHSLNTSMIERRDLEDAIEAELGRIRAFSPIKCSLEVEGTAYELNPETRLLIFRIIQEALQNVVKHAGAKTVTIKMKYAPGKLELRIIDDGKGIDMREMNGQASLGMANMHQRAQLLKGNLQVSSDGKHGTEVALNIPL